MLFSSYPVVVRGGGDLGTGAVYRLWKGGFPVVVLEQDPPLAVRLGASAAGAVREDRWTVEDLVFRKAADLAGIDVIIGQGEIPVIAAPSLPALEAFRFPGFPPITPKILVDARMMKKKTDIDRSQAPFVVALGPGHTAGVDCHAVIETMRGHTLGKVIWQGTAISDTGVPAEVEGRGSERVLRAPAAGTVLWEKRIGDRVVQGERIGSIGTASITAPFDGILRGRISEGVPVNAGLKIGDVDPRAGRDACFTISDKARAIGGGVLEAVLWWIGNGRADHP